MANLIENGLKVGDEVAINSRYHSMIETVTKVNKSTFVAGGITFNSNGRERGGDTWSAHFANLATEEEKKRIKEENARRKIANILRKYDYDSLSLEELTKIYDIISKN